MKVTPSPALMNSSLAASLCLLAGAMSVNAASIALDQMAYNPPWGRTSLDSVNAYTAISGDGGSANQVYAASAAGGIVAWGFNKTWSPGTWGSFTYARIDTDDANGRIKAYCGEGDFTDDPLTEMSGTKAVAKIPQLQQLFQNVCRRGFAHHAAITTGRVAASLDEAFGNYLGWDAFRH